MKKFNDSRFGKVIEPESPSELLDLIAFGSDGTGTTVRMWRGQSDEQWLIDSAAYRKMLLSKNDERMEWHVAHYEKRLLEKARHKGYGILDGRNLSDFELLARLQHHGAATRLIDTSRSGLIALYFACLGNFDRAGMLFGIHTDYLGGGEGKLLDETYDERVKSIEKYNHPQTWEPPVVSPRIAAQHSQFIYSTTKVGLPHGSLAIEKLDYLLAIRIPAQEKQVYLAMLSANFDVNHLSLFPDIDGFGIAYGSGLEQWANERW
ncbi:FRG domain-containing protein [Pelagibacterium luteolum]|uniref:FRG domain-containing protein n=1 Tax=Pelagibacterium luteolum TaxID=440168 RepID=A0A1G7TRE0_9HYPH|nr:FRG domain-containing protein [Pelagibacterium luteolum]SDG37209.1 FRG domain-containing protein [Pelagibacterium luteolum]